MNLTTNTEGPVTVLTVTGDLNVYTAPLLRQEITNAIETGHYRLVIDLTGCTFMDYTGLGVLVGGLKKARAHDGAVSVACDGEPLLKVFRVTGLTKVFTIHESAAGAVAALSAEVASGAV